MHKKVPMEPHAETKREGVIGTSKGPLNDEQFLYVLSRSFYIETNYSIHGFKLASLFFWDLLLKAIFLSYLPYPVAMEKKQTERS